MQSILARCGNCAVPVYEKLNLNANYTIIITDYLSEGGDGLSFEKVVKYQSLGEWDANIWIQKYIYYHYYLLCIHVCYKIRNNGFANHGRRVPREITDMAGSQSTDSAAQRGRIEQGTDN